MTSYDNIFILDTEATSPSPMTGLMTEFGLVHMTSGLSFYGKLYAFTPHPDIPALPVVTDPTPNAHYVSQYVDGNAVLGAVGVSHAVMDVTLEELAQGTDEWVRNTCPDGQRPIMVSDNPGYDSMWLTCFLDSQGVANPFGHSSRRIGDFYAGTKGNWRRCCCESNSPLYRHNHLPGLHVRWSSFRSNRPILSSPKQQ